MVTWPASLPQKFLSSGFQRQYPDNRMRSDNDAGPAKVRRRSSLNVYTISGSMVMTQAQVDTLDTFINTTLGSGVLNFDFPDPDDAVVTIDVRYGEKLPVLARSGAFWVVETEFEVLP